ncbi:hypothetical protein M406DRAFT_108678 [Cryphonectria parasitica EP155]|uniref:Uncharacterized protein n=1 Tax=Cryphonectria parasitica (strain ATCC 38755 / EP155) TaxID=660469 RepID=A0A9P5CN10_CRYP1|nr:uncharacterized protein M406DRAFT_108678 [Cryphonectria parasitica EP155]KAF3763641.1 hypothetical protein M406DRAFT_108678 [Cryphonectria parasitica EP155]
MSENQDESQANDVVVPIYCLTTLTQAEQDSLLAALENERSDDNAEPLDFVKPKLVPWTEEKDGDIGDLYRLYRKLIQDADEKSRIYEFFFFVDRACLGTAKEGETKTNKTQIILAQPDAYTLQYSPATVTEMQTLLRTHGSGVLPEWDEGLAEELDREMLLRALTYGRLPVGMWRDAWANLDIANMDMGEMVEGFGGDGEEKGVIERVDDPAWDGEAFVRRVEEVYRKREEENKA